MKNSRSQRPRRRGTPTAALLALLLLCAGLLDGNDPLAAMRREAIEETGYAVKSPRKVFEAYMSPGSVTEKLHFFVAEYEPRMKIGSGGGIADEGEDIEIVELPVADALAMTADGRIADGKTIMLLQWAVLSGLLARPAATSQLRAGG